jgi:hypothetical protein
MMNAIKVSINRKKDIQMAKDFARKERDRRSMLIFGQKHMREFKEHLDAKNEM